MNQWLSLPELMERWQTSLTENVFDAIRAGLPVYEYIEVGGTPDASELWPNDFMDRFQAGPPWETGIQPLNLNDVRFLAADVETFELAHNGAGQTGIVYDTPQNELAEMCSVEPRTVSNWTKKGLLCEKRGREKLYSLPLTTEWLKKNGKRKELESLNNSK